MKNHWHFFELFSEFISQKNWLASSVPKARQTIPTMSVTSIFTFPASEFASIVKKSTDIFIEQRLCQRIHMEALASLFPS